jgi:hypothetical protein
MKQLELKDYFHHRCIFYGGLESKSYDNRIINNCKVHVSVYLNKEYFSLRTGTNINQGEYLRNVVWKELKEREKTFEPLDFISAEQKDNYITEFHYYYNVEGQINEVARFNNMKYDWFNFFIKTT